MSSVAGLWLCLVVPSLAQVEKHLGTAGLVAYPVVVAAVLKLLPPTRIGRNLALTYAALTLAGVALVFVLVFPIANAGPPGSGSDTDESYDVTVRALLRGSYPYYERTYLDNTIHYLPGSILLAAPFVLLGSSGWQNVFWLGLFFVASWRILADPGEALVLLWVMLALSPAVVHQVVTGVDGLSSTVAIVVAMWWVAKARSPGAAFGAVVLFGLALASRPNFLAAVPLAAAVVWRGTGPRAAVIRVGSACVLAAVLSLAFYAHDPAAFTPLEGANRVTRFAAILPFAGVVLPAAAAAVALLWSFRAAALPSAWAGFAASQAVLVVSGIVLATLRERSLDLEYAGYGSFFLFPGALAAWHAWRGPGRPA